MIRDLDDTLKAILDDPASPTELRNADVSFEAPDKGFAPAQATVNLFLYEVKENRELRDPVPITEKVGDIFVRRQPPLRADCTYIATTWSSQVGAAKVAEEHRLLSQALLWLSRFPIIPADFLQGSLINPPFPHPTMVAQMDGNKNAGEFWSALGIPPRPAFYLIVTIAVDLRQQVEGPLVTTAILGYQQGGDAGTREEWINIGGVVRTAAGNPVVDAWVRLEPAGQTEVTKEDGSFVFIKVKRGTSYTLRARAVGLGEVSRNIEIPALTGEYNLQFP